MIEMYLENYESPFRNVLEYTCWMALNAWNKVNQFNGHSMSHVFKQMYKENNFERPIPQETRIEADADPVHGFTAS